MAPDEPGNACTRLSSAGLRGQTESDEANLRAARRPSTFATGGLRFEFRDPRLERGRVRLYFRLGEARERRRQGDWETGRWGRVAR